MNLAVRATVSESSGPSPNKHVVDQMMVNYVQIGVQLSGQNNVLICSKKDSCFMHGFLAVKLVCI